MLADIRIPSLTRPATGSVQMTFGIVKKNVWREAQPVYSMMVRPAPLQSVQ